MIEAAARTALEPTASRSSAVIDSSGADIVEGMSALHGWGLAARALADCSGIVPTSSSSPAPPSPAPPCCSAWPTTW